jgi:hypothetical protein
MSSDMAALATLLVSSALLAGSAIMPSSERTVRTSAPASAGATIVSPALAEGGILSAIVETPYDEQARRLSLTVDYTAAHRSERTVRTDTVQVEEVRTTCRSGFPDSSCVAKIETLRSSGDKRLIVFVPTATDYP